MSYPNIYMCVIICAAEPWVDSCEKLAAAMWLNTMNPYLLRLDVVNILNRRGNIRTRRHGR